MDDLEILIDKTINFGIDQAIKELDRAKTFPPFGFLVHTDACFTAIVPTDTDYYLDDGVMLDALKSFANQQLTEQNVEGYSVMSLSKTTIHHVETDIMVVYCKFKNDTLPLKTRMYYFPFAFIGDKPFIHFENAFASEG